MATTPSDLEFSNMYSETFSNLQNINTNSTTYLPIESLSNKVAFNKYKHSWIFDRESFPLNESNDSIPTYPDYFFHDNSLNPFILNANKTQEKLSNYNILQDKRPFCKEASSFIDHTKGEFDKQDLRNLKFLTENPNEIIEYLCKSSESIGNPLYSVGPYNKLKALSRVNSQLQDHFHVPDNYEHRENEISLQNMNFIGIIGALENSHKSIKHQLAKYEIYLRLIAVSAMDREAHQEHKNFFLLLNNFLETMIKTFLSYRMKFGYHFYETIPSNGSSKPISENMIQLLKTKSYKSDSKANFDSLSTSASNSLSSPLLDMCTSPSLDFNMDNIQSKFHSQKSNSSQENKLVASYQKSYKETIHKEASIYDFPRAASYEKNSQLKFIASANVVGRLFDYNGEHIRKLQNQFRVKISTSGNRVFYPGTGKQVLLFKGQLLDIMFSIRTVFNMMIPDLLDLSQLNDHFNPDAIKFEISIVIPSTTSNKILSSKGAFIQKIQNNTSARIHVTCMRFEMDEIQERLATITGLRSEIEKTIEAIALIIQDDPNKKNYSFLDYPLYTKAHKN